MQSHGGHIGGPAQAEVSEGLAPCVFRFIRLDHCCLNTLCNVALCLTVVAVIHRVVQTQTDQRGGPAEAVVSGGGRLPSVFHFIRLDLRSLNTLCGVVLRLAVVSGIHRVVQTQSDQRGGPAEAVVSGGRLPSVLHLIRLDLRSLDTLCSVALRLAVVAGSCYLVSSRATTSARRTGSWRWGGRLPIRRAPHPPRSLLS